MIVQYLIDAIISVIEGIFGILPSLPATPSSVVSAGSWVTDTITSVIAVFNMVYGSALMAAIMVVILGLLNFTWVYHTLMWIIRKIPVLNIH
jgi:hypothetical protein